MPPVGIAKKKNNNNNNNKSSYICEAHEMCVWEVGQWLYMSGFMGQQCEAHVMTMFGKTVV